jgi:hypothetical protein
MILSNPCCATLLAVFVPAIGAAQPARIGNIWNGLPHQPTESEVLNAERAAGVAPTDAQARHQQQELDRMSRNLLRRAAGDASTADAMPTAPTPR